MLLQKLILLLFFFPAGSHKVRSSPAAPKRRDLLLQNHRRRTGVDWNEHANYTCDQGFVLAGNMTRTCGNSSTDGSLGQWGPNRDPSCVGEYRSKKKAWS